MFKIDILDVYCWGCMRKKNKSGWDIPSIDIRELPYSMESKLVLAYLEKFECIPVFDNYRSNKKLARKNQAGGWDICEPNGSTIFERDPINIDSKDDQLAFLLRRSWHIVGFFSFRSVVESTMNTDGSGFSRYAIWGGNTNTMVPEINDYFWHYKFEKDSIVIDWGREECSRIKFSMFQDLHVGFSSSGDMSFFDIVLKVDKPFFPPNAEFACGLLHEYWGKERAFEEMR